MRELLDHLTLMNLVHHYTHQLGQMLDSSSNLDKLAGEGCSCC